MHASSQLYSAQEQALYTSTRGSEVPLGLASVFVCLLYRVETEGHFKARK